MVDEAGSGGSTLDTATPRPGPEESAVEASAAIAAAWVLSIVSADGSG